jgi:hypothetical protein
MCLLHQCAFPIFLQGLRAALTYLASLPGSATLLPGNRNSNVARNCKQPAEQFVLSISSTTIGYFRCTQVAQASLRYPIPLSQHSPHSTRFFTHRNALIYQRKFFLTTLESEQ